MLEKEFASIKQAPAYVVYKMGKLLDHAVAELDPLDLDSVFADGLFVRASVSDCTHKILALFERKVGVIKVEAIRKMSEVSAMAAARDLNMFASALTKHNVPFRVVPHLETLLILLSEKTWEVPTDTVFGYGPRNPVGPRRRMFTGTAEEGLFIQSFTDGMNSLLIALAGLETVQMMSIADARYEIIMHQASQGLNGMISAIESVWHKITPQFFTQRLRPFFEPKTIGSRTYFAAGGAQMPVTMIDLLLWGIEESNRLYISYRNENLQYLPQSYRRKTEAMLQGKSLLRSIQDEIGAGVLDGSRDRARESIRSVLSFTEQMVKFRTLHLRVAKANMAIRPAGSKGSGGYDMMLLRYLLRKTNEARKTLSFLEKT